MVIPAVALLAGIAPCASCHHAVAEQYRLTAHSRTSSRATEDTVRGSFDKGKNILRTGATDVYFQMERRGDSFYQTAYDHGKTHTERFDLVMGSGRRGQSYLYMKQGAIYQLPVSFSVAAGGWITSPGYPDGKVYFDREIQPSCMECHSTRSGQQLLPGITCQKCHGGGDKHPAHLDRAAGIAICANCHSGMDADPKPEVHGNQVGLLKRSRCFQKSAAMTCATCHNIHQVERDLVAMSKKCITCHANQAAKSDNCIDCHMPKQDSQAITFRTAGKVLAQSYRTHTIGIY